MSYLFNGSAVCLILSAFPYWWLAFILSGKGSLYPTKMAIIRSVMQLQLPVQPFRALQCQKELRKQKALTKMHQHCRMALANQVIVPTAYWRVLALVLLSEWMLKGKNCEVSIIWLHYTRTHTHTLALFVACNPLLKMTWQSLLVVWNGSFSCVGQRNLTLHPLLCDLCWVFSEEETIVEHDEEVVDWWS